MSAIEIRGLTKSYGDVRALDGLDLTVPEGRIFGFLGPNGAGKTTTIRILLGMAAATSGTVELLGRPLGTDPQRRARVGYLPDAPGYYPWMRAGEFLRFSASLFGLDRATTDARVAVLLEMADLADVRQRVGGYSRGMKQRLGIAQALINAPDLLILDEPTSALDPVGRRDVLEMLVALRGRTTVFFSTHLLDDVERVCDDVAVLHKGRLVTQSTVAGLLATHGSSLRFRLDVAGAERLLPRLRAEAWLVRLTPVEGAGEAFVVQTKDPAATSARLPVLMAETGTSLRRFEPLGVTLEDVFVDLLGEPGRLDSGGAP